MIRIPGDKEHEERERQGRGGKEAETFSNKIKRRKREIKEVRRACTLPLSQHW